MLTNQKYIDLSAFLIYNNHQEEKNMPNKTKHLLSSINDSFGQFLSKRSIKLPYKSREKYHNQIKSTLKNWNILSDDDKPLYGTDKEPIIKSYDQGELSGQLIDILEDILEENNISILNDEHENSSEEAIIYGSDYDELNDAIRQIMIKNNIYEP